MASMLLAAAPPLYSQFHKSSSCLSFSHSETLYIPFFSPNAPLSVSAISSTSPVPLVVYCGRGDKKTEKGKRFNHSYGNARPRNKKKSRGPARLYAPPKEKKDPFEDNEVVKIEIDESLFSG